MKLETKFDVNKATLDHIWLGDDDGNDVYIVQVTEPVNRTERIVWPGESLDRKVRNVCDQPETIKKLLFWIKKALLESENMVISVTPDLVNEDTGMPQEDVRYAMVCLSKMQSKPYGEGCGDGNWMTWHDKENWDADIYPQVLTEFLWTISKTEELTDDDVSIIDRFQHDLVEFVVSHAIVGVDKTEDDIRWIVDRAEFVGELADDICEFCADRGVDIHYPEQVTDTITGDQTVHRCAEPNNYSERDKWMSMLHEHYEAEED